MRQSEFITTLIHALINGFFGSPHRSVLRVSMFGSEFAWTSQGGSERSTSCSYESIVKISKMILHRFQ